MFRLKTSISKAKKIVCSNLFKGCPEAPWRFASL